MNKTLAIAVVLACTSVSMAETISNRSPRAGGKTTQVLVPSVVMVSAPARRPRAGGTVAQKAPANRRCRRRPTDPAIEDTVVRIKEPNSDGPAEAEQHARRAAGDVAYPG
jgi:hypothetical protein